ncbi:hypothetical protein I5677_05325 [Mobilitalea sibirica]|uniref:Uncharacterized protein n=1 Tax=Mobilitalea sibirica TaxID=1462919 RepID=A0A8J7HAU3_9FIRM|nr:hypothetical protein [Mobilitalea sibirica]MBH1940316.1 hypothetical protein [Mobilitalea sibirica]
MKIKHLVNKIQIISLILMLSLFGGCSKGENEIIISLDNINLTLDDFRYDIYLIETEGNSYDEYYRNQMDISYWDYQYNGVTMRETAKNSIITRVVMYEILADQAKKAGIILTNQEKNDDEKAVNDLLNSLSETERNSTGLNKDILTKTFHKLSLGDKYYMELSKRFVIDETSIRNSISIDEYREYITECIYTATVSSKNKEIKPLDEAKQKKAYERISTALKQIHSGTDFQTIIKQDDTISYYTRSFIYRDSTPEQIYRDKAILLSNGEYSDIVTTEFGHYIIHMVNNNSSARYEEAVKEAVKAEENRQFEMIYNQIKAEYSIVLNDEYWDSIVIGDKIDNE